MIQNTNDKYQGDKIVMLDDPGEFPAITKFENGSMVLRNGGIPQEGNLVKHLEAFERDVKKAIPHESFKGIGVINFDQWIPIYRQNIYEPLVSYQSHSIIVEKQKHPTWTEKEIEHEATERFEKHARIFMEETLKRAKELRPWGKWGYHGYPKCQNSGTKMQKYCNAEVVIENDKLSWLFSRMDVFLPVTHVGLGRTVQSKKDYVEARLNEALRVSRNLEEHPKIIPYYWYKNNNDRQLFATEEDLIATFKTIYESGADGFILWRPYRELDTKAGCKYFYEYLQDELGPAVRTTLRENELTNENEAQNCS